MTENEPKIVDLPPERWLRGEGSWCSYLHRARDGRMCCIGLLAFQHLGMDEDALLGARELPASKRKPEWEIVLNYLYRLNDEDGSEDGLTPAGPISDQDRIKNLNDAAERHGFPFRFRLVGKEATR